MSSALGNNHHSQEIVMNELTQRLADGDHPVIVGEPQPSPEELRQRMEEIGYVIIKFTGTRGGTDLGMAVDRDASDLSAVNFDEGSGTLHIEGTLILNDDPVRCIADIDLATLSGTGHLVPIKESELIAG
jgi:hypothetical protein